MSHRKDRVRTTCGCACAGMCVCGGGPFRGDVCEIRAPTERERGHDGRAIRALGTRSARGRCCTNNKGPHLRQLQYTGERVTAEEAHTHTQRGGEPTKAQEGEKYELAKKEDSHTRRHTALPPRQTHAPREGRRGGRRAEDVDQASAADLWDEMGAHDANTKNEKIRENQRKEWMPSSARPVRRRERETRARRRADTQLLPAVSRLLWRRAQETESGRVGGQCEPEEEREGGREGGGRGYD